MRIGLDFAPLLFDRGGSAVYVAQLFGALRSNLPGGDSLVGLRPPGRRWRRGGPLWKAQVLACDLAWTPGLLPLAAWRRTDVLHCTTFKAPTWSAVPLVVTVHDAIPIRHPEWFGGWSARYAQHRLPRVIGAADRIVVDCAHSRDDVAELYPRHADRLVVIPLGVSSDFEPQGPERVAEVRERLRLRRPFVLAVGTLEPRKNLAMLIRAFARLTGPGFSDLELVVAGASGWRFEPGAVEVSDGVRARVRWLGYVADADLATLYTAACVFVFPSLAEGFGLPPLEAMACGAQVVSSARKPMTDLLGDAAVYFDPLDPEAMAAALAQAIEQPNSERRARGLTIARGFSWAATALATLELYREVVLGGRREARREHPR